jgi:hypothetical protein
VYHLSIPKGWLFSAIALLGFLPSPRSLAAQPLHIHYNLETGVPVYILDKDTIDQPRVKHRDEVFFHLENLNTFRFSADVEETSDPVDVRSGGGNPLSMLSGLLPTSGLPGMEFLGSGNATSSGADLAYDDMKATSVSSGFATTEQAAVVEAVKKDFESTLLSMVETEKEIARLNKNIKECLNRRTSVMMAKQEIKRLKSHAGLKASQIIEISNEFITKAVGDTNGKGFDMLAYAEKKRVT